MKALDIDDLSPSGQMFQKMITGRRATPSFDGTPVPHHVLTTIIKAGMQAPSAYNLQPWRFIVVCDAQQKQLLRQAAMGQPKIEEAGAVIVACGDLNAPRGKNLEKILAESGKHGFNPDQSKAAQATIEKVFGAPAGNAMGLAPDYAVWVNRHVMIAFTTMMWMAEALGYDTAPMEGFFEDQVKSVLGIPEGIRVIALLGVGKLKGADKLYAGRHNMADICFVDHWGESMKD